VGGGELKPRHVLRPLQEDSGVCTHESFPPHREGLLRARQYVPVPLPPVHPAGEDPMGPLRSAPPARPVINNSNDRSGGDVGGPPRPGTQDPIGYCLQGEGEGAQGEGAHEGAQREVVRLDPGRS
jgi:hypothetical protein